MTTREVNRHELKRVVLSEKHVMVLHVQHEGCNRAHKQASGREVEHIGCEDGEQVHHIAAEDGNHNEGAFAAFVLVHLFY